MMELMTGIIGGAVGKALYDLLKPPAQIAAWKVVVYFNANFLPEYDFKKAIYKQAGMDEEVREMDAALKATLEELADRINDIEESKIKTPQMNIIEPILDDFKNKYTNEMYRKIYVKFIADSCNKDYKDFYHTGMIEILKIMSPRDLELTINGDFPLISFEVSTKVGGLIKVAKYFSLDTLECKLKDSMVIANLTRLGIVEKDRGDMRNAGKMLIYDKDKDNAPSEITINNKKIDVYELLKEDLNALKINKELIKEVENNEYILTEFGEEFKKMFIM